MHSLSPAFGPWMRARRQAAGLTLDALAAQAGCSPVMIRKLESGTRRPSAPLAALLAALLGVPAADHPAFVDWARGGAAATPALPAAPVEPAAPEPAIRETPVAGRYAACTPAEQVVLRALAVFAGGASFDGLEAVLGAAELGDPAGLLDAVERLVDRGLVATDAHRPAMPRFALPPTLRACVVAQTAATGAGPLLRAAHATYFAGLVARLAPTPPAWDTLADEGANLRLALAWYTAHDPPAGLDLLLRLLPVWEAAGHHAAGQHWLDRLLPPADPPAAIRSHALYWAGRLWRAQGEYGAAEPLLQQALSLAAAGEGPLLAAIWHELGQCAEATGADGVALACYERSLAAPGPDRAPVLARLGRLRLQQGDPAQAEAALLASLAIWRQQGAKAPMIAPLLTLGAAARSRQDWDQARAYYHEAARLGPGQADVAAAVQCGLGYVALAHHDRPAALAAFRAAAVAAPVAPAAHWAIAAGLAATLLTGPRSDLPGGVRLAAAVATALAAAGRALLPVDAATLAAAVTAARARLAAAAWATAWADGCTHPLDQVLAALLPPVRPPAPAALSAREQDVVRLLAQGLTNRDIATALIVSPNTVQTHLRHIYAKLGVRTRSALTRYAIDQGLLATE